MMSGTDIDLNPTPVPPGDALPRELVLLERAATFLVECQGLDEVRSLRDRAEAMRLYTRKIADSQRSQNAAAAIKLKAEHRMGELLAEMEKQGPGDHWKKKRSHDATVTPTIAEIGITKSDSSRCQAIAAIPREQFHAIIEHACKNNRELTSKEMVQRGKAIKQRAAGTEGIRGSEVRAGAGALRAPFPYFGGKSAVAGLVWERLGDVRNYIEPFCGSAAVLLARPHPPRIETINDADAFVANFWRATGRDPEAVAEHADWPVNEADVYARHRWLVQSDEARAILDRIRTDPEFFDPKVAGWWCWGACCWIGAGWCREGEHVDDKRPQICTGNTTHGPGVRRRVDDKMPRLAGGRKGDEYYGGLGVHAELHPDVGDGRPQLADAYSRGRGVHGHDSAGTCAERRAWLIGWFGELRDRLRTVRVCCGNWRRVCDSESVTTRLGTTGVFLDPPYSREAGRCKDLYGVDSETVARDVRAYCSERGPDPGMRIVLCGYAGEGHEELEAAGWSVIAWRAAGGYGNRSEKGRANAGRERLWCSPHCEPPPP
jgi:hypothetical protein